MNARQLKFVQEYLVDLNATQAAIRAGYCESTAASSACRLLINAKVSDAIAVAQAERSAETKIDAAWVLKRAALLANFNIQDFTTIGDNGLACYDFTNATRDDWYCISEYTVKQVYKNVIPVSEVRLKTYDKGRMLELVGKHVNVQAFKDRVEHSGTVTIEKVERTIVKTQGEKNATTPRKNAT